MKQKKTSNDTNAFKQSIRDKMQNGLPSKDGFGKERRESPGQPNRPN